ncbi:hypothetical protein [Limnohabitans sp.]|uniref:hypothetical protein n=1 Tax=Limnohabitans sp. TaxID=1907725 RepID=UPI0033413A7E
MGWLFSPRWATRADLVQHLRRPERFGDNLQLVRACVTGSHHWYLVRVRATGQHWIGLDLMQSGRADGWGYKDMDESVGPSAVDCPLAYLAAPHAEPLGYAGPWRERVRAYHAARQAKPAPVAGAWVQLSGHAYRLIEPAGPRRGWRVSDEIGRTYRMQARQLARAEPCENPSQARQAMAA